MIKFSIARKAIAVVANLSLLFNSFVPFLLVAQPAYAQSSETVVSTIEYNQSANKLNINVNTSEKIAYQLFYKTDKIDAIAGDDLNQADFYLGTCSASVCLPQNISRGILKTESGSEFHSQFFTLENNILTITKESESLQSDLTKEENDFLNDSILGVTTNWTFENVELNKEYIAPQNSGVKLTFTKLPENSGNIKIEEITLTSEQIEQSGSLSDKAYDITSDMEDGTFAYNLSLPIPESAKGQNVDIKFAEEISQINSAEIASNTTETNSITTATNLDHFTIFFVSATLATATLNNQSQVTVYPNEIIKATLNVNLNKLSGWDYSEWKIGDGPWNKFNTPDHINLIWWSTDHFSGNLNITAPSNIGTYNVSFKVCPFNSYNNCETITLINGIIVKPFCGNGFTDLDKEEQCDTGVNNGQICTPGYNSTCNYCTNECKTATIDNLDVIPPSTPSLVSPLNNSFIKGASVTNEWSVVDDAVEYIYESYHNQEATNLRWHQVVSAPAHSKTATNVADATFWWRVKSVDGVGNTSPWSPLWKVTIDNTNPIIPSNLSFSAIDGKVLSCDSVTNLYTIVAKWNASSDTNFSHYEYKSFNPTTGWVWNGGNIGNVLSKIGTLNGGEGTYGFAVRGVDKAGNASDWTSLDLANSCKITYDKTLPVITLGAYTTAPTNQDITITATTNEGTLNIGSTTFTTNGLFDFIATDSAGNIATKTVTITNIDKEKPTTPQSMDFKNPNLSCGSITNQKNITIDWSDSSDNVKVVGYDYFVDYPNGASRGKWNTSFTQSQYRGSLNEGIHYIQVRAKDAAGNVSDWTNLCSIAYDSIAPTITVNSFITNNKTPTLTGTVNDNTATVSVKVNNADYIATNNNGIWSIITSTLADSTYDVIASATDTAGNIGTDSTTNELTVDSIAPTATYKHYIGETEFTGSIAYVNSLSKLSFTGEYLDATPSSGLLKDSYVIFDAQADHSFKFAQNSAKSYCSWRTEPNLVDGLLGTKFSLTNKESFTNCISDLGEGEYYMTHQVYDNAIRQDIPSITQFRDVLGLHFIVDKTAPSLSNKTTFEDIWYNTDQTSIFNFTDENGIVSGNNPTCTINTEGSQQTCSVDLNVCDIAGNCNTETIISNSVNIDKTKPTINSSINPVSPDGQNGWYWTQPEITLTGTDANLDKIEYQWDSQIEGSWTTYSVAIKPLTEGNHDLYYRAIDKAGNVSTIVSKNIRWDKTDLEYGPQNLSANPNPTSGSTSKIKWEMGKDNTGIDKYEIQWKLDDSHSYSKTVGAGTTEVEIDQLIEGKWTVKVVAFDQSGRAKDASIDLNVDRTSPTSPTLVLNSTGTGTATLSWNVIDDAKDYIIWYGSVQGIHPYGARVGNVTSYTVKGLGAGNYYFIVKAVDAAQNQSSDSNEVNTGTIIGAAGTNPNQPAEGFSTEVLGANTEEEINPTTTPAIELGDVLGSSTAEKLINWWWLLLLIIPLYVIGRKLSKKKK